MFMFPLKKLARKALICTNITCIVLPGINQHKNCEASLQTKIIVLTLLGFIQDILDLF